MSLIGIVSQSPAETWENPVTLWGDSFSTSRRALPDELHDIAVDESGDTRLRYPQLSVPRWVTVGNNGAIYFTTHTSNQFDEIRWNKADTPSKANLFSVHFDQGKWVTAGDEGNILVSENGSDWALTHSLPNVRFSDVSSRPDEWMVAGWENVSGSSNIRSKGWLATSGNGKVWRTISFPGFKIKSAANDETRWLVVGEYTDTSGDQTAVLLESENGQDWTQVELKNLPYLQNASFSHITFGQGKWLAALEYPVDDLSNQTKLLSSTDGNSWNEVLTLMGTISKPLYERTEWTFLNQKNANLANMPASTLVFHSLDAQAWSVIEAVDSEIIGGNAISSAGLYRMMIGRPGYASIVQMPKYDQMIWNPPLKLNDVEENNGDWVAVGLRGKIAISNDGVNWENVDTDISVNFLKIIHRNGWWVALGKEGEIWVSKDRLNWDKRYLNENVSFRDLGFGEGTWIAAAFNIHSNTTTLLLSHDLIVWDPLELDLKSTVLSLDYGDGIWLLQNDRTVLRSNDGKHWESTIIRGIETGWWTDRTDVTFGDGKWIINSSDSLNSIGKRYVSSNAKDWQILTTPSCEGMWYEGGFWWAVYSSKGFGGRYSWIQYSPDGFNWNWFRDMISPNDLIIRNNRLYLFGLSASIILSTGTPPLSVRQISTSLNDVDYGNQQWLAMDDQQTLVSNDGINWRRHAKTPIPSMEWIAFGDDQWSLIGSQKAIRSGETEWHNIFYTYRFETGFEEQFRLLNHVPQDLTYGFGRWWLVFEKKVYNWAAESGHALVYDASNELETSEKLKGLTFSNQEVVAFSNKGTVIQSDVSNSFEQWQSYSVSSAETHDPNLSKIEYSDIGWADGQWILAGAYTRLGNAQIRVERSKDGIDWSGKALPVGSAGNFSSVEIAHGDGRWMIVGANQQNAFLEFFESKDGVEWNQGKSIYSTAPPKELIYGNNQWILALANGKLLRSGPNNWLRMSRSNAEQKPILQIFGQANATLDFQTSSDMKNWENWETVFTQPSSVTIEETNDPESSAVFIRATQ